MFPGGVPGVTQGIPPEYVRGNQPPPETAQAPPPAQAKAAAAGEEEKDATAEPEQKPKPKPKKVAKPKPQPPGAGHCAAVSMAATAGAASRTTEQPVAGSGTSQHCVTLAFLAATRHLPALTALALDPKANHAAKT